MSGTYYKLAQWDSRALCFRDGKRGFDTEAAARAAAVRPGRYRVSTVTPDGRTDGEPFEVAGTAAPAPKPKLERGGLKRTPGPWHRS